MKIKRKKTLFSILALALLLLMLMLFLRYPKTKNKIVFVSEKIQVGNIENSITATGTIEPIIQVEVGTQVSGIIDKIYVDYNSRVIQGQVIAELQKTILEQELQSAQSDLASNNNEYEYQKKNHERFLGLFQKKLISPSEYDEALYTYQRSQSAYEKSKASYRKAQTNLGYATIYSPIDGVVISKAVDEGQTVAASFSTPTLFTIANNLENMQVIANVDEADIGQVEVGMDVCFSVDAFPSDLFKGGVTQVRLEPKTTNNVVTYEVVIHAPNPEKKLKPGLTANINIYSLRKNQVLLLPIKATLFEPSFSQKENKKHNQSNVNDTIKCVWVKTPQGKMENKLVRVGASDGIYYEVLSGLKPQEEVYLSSQSELESQTNISNQGNTSGESSPFMPKRPETNRNKSNPR